MATKPINPPLPYAVVTVRLSRPLHAALAELSHEKRTSVNAICVNLIERAVSNNDPAAAVLREKRREAKENSRAK